MSSRLRLSARAMVIVFLQLTTACTGVGWQPVALPPPAERQADSLPARSITGEVRVTAVDSSRITLRDVQVSRDSVIGWHNTGGPTQRAAFPLLAVLSLERRDPGAAGATGAIGVLVVGLLALAVASLGSLGGNLFP